MQDYFYTLPSEYSSYPTNYCRMYSPYALAGYLPANPAVIRPQLLASLASGESVYPLPGKDQYYVLWRKSMLHPGWTCDPPDSYTGATMVDASSELFGLSTIWLGADFFRNNTNHHWPEIRRVGGALTEAANSLKTDDYYAHHAVMMNSLDEREV